MSSCGWHAGIELAPDEESIGLEIFDNRTRERGVEREFHAELARALHRLVDAPTHDPANADVIIRGEVKTFRRRGGISMRNNRQIETAVSVSASASLWDAASGRRLAGPVTARARVGYTLESPGHEREALQRTLRNLSDRLLVDLLTRRRISEDPSDLPAGTEEKPKEEPGSAKLPAALGAPDTPGW